MNPVLFFFDERGLLHSITNITVAVFGNDETGAVRLLSNAPFSVYNVPPTVCPSPQATAPQREPYSPPPNTYGFSYETHVEHGNNTNDNPPLGTTFVG